MNDSEDIIFMSDPYFKVIMASNKCKHELDVFFCISEFYNNQTATENHSFCEEANNKSSLTLNGVFEQICQILCRL